MGEHHVRDCRCQVCRALAIGDDIGWAVAWVCAVVIVWLVVLPR